MRPPGTHPTRPQPASRYHVPCDVMCPQRPKTINQSQQTEQNDVKSERQYLYLADCWMVQPVQSPIIRLDTLRDSDIKIEIYVWYINVVNFSPFLSYAMFGGAEHCHNCY